jgi:hypothetical protein
MIQDAVVGIQFSDRVRQIPANILNLYIGCFLNKRPFLGFKIATLFRHSN